MGSIKELILEEAKKLNMHFNEYLISCHKKALKENEELTFSDEEIDKLLPTRIRKLQ